MINIVKNVFSQSQTEENGESYKMIKTVMKTIEDASCVKFKELTIQQITTISEQSYLKIFAAHDSE